MIQQLFSIPKANRVVSLFTKQHAVEQLTQFHFPIIYHHIQVGAMVTLIYNSSSKQYNVLFKHYHIGNVNFMGPTEQPKPIKAMVVNLVKEKYLAPTSLTIQIQ